MCFWLPDFCSSSFGACLEQNENASNNLDGSTNTGGQSTNRRVFCYVEITPTQAAGRWGLFPGQASQHCSGASALRHSAGTNTPSHWHAHCCSPASSPAFRRILPTEKKRRKIYCSIRADTGQASPSHSTAGTLEPPRHLFCSLAVTRGSHPAQPGAQHPCCSCP